MTYLLKRILFILFLIALLIFTGTAGYMTIEKWNLIDSLYMTVITLSTVGYGEVYHLSNTGRLFTIFLIVGGIGLTTYAFTTLTSIIVSGDIKNFFRRMKMEKEISYLKNHFIICGNTHVGLSIADELRKTNRDYVIIVLNENEADDLISEGYNVIEGDATEDETLIKAKIEKARGIFTTLKNDKDNAFIALSAKSLNPKIKVASVQNEQGTNIAQKLKKSGVDIIINPFFIGGLRMVSEMIRPQVVDFLDHMLRDRSSNIRFEELKITKNHKFFNKTVADIKKMLDDDVLLVSLKHGNKYIIKPDNDITLQENDILIFLGETKKIFQV